MTSIYRDEPPADNICMDIESAECVQPQDKRELTLIDPEMFYDLLMEQQEQM